MNRVVRKRRAARGAVQRYPTQSTFRLTHLGVYESIYTQHKESPPRSRDTIKASEQSTTSTTHLEIFDSEDSSLLRVEMRGFTLNTVCQCGLLTYLVLFSFMTFTAAVSFDLTELRNKVAKIKVNPRGNLWATGKNHLQRPWNSL